jgi:D-serine deaminase-like pyridoxal phosphate-dependent protein
MLRLQDVVSPTLVVDESKARANIQRMAHIAKTHQLIFRPHFKTHQSALVGNWFKEEGVTKITVSNLEMAYYFAQHGWNDITLAIPINIRDLARINRLAAHIKLNLVLDDLETLAQLQAGLEKRCSIYIKLDTGYGRAGIPCNDMAKIKALLHQLAKSQHTVFEGFVWHDGHTYQAHNTNQIRAIRHTTLERLQPLKTFMKELGTQVIFSGGDTPSCSICDDYAGMDEIRPGNFVFYDWMQHSLGSCTSKQIAVAMFCPVLRVYHDRNQVLIHGGAVHFSKESLQSDSKPIYGKIVLPKPDLTWGEPLEMASLISISQEHGLIEGSEEWVKNVKAGQLIGVLPVHSCLTVACMGGYTTTDGQKAVIYKAD